MEIVLVEGRSLTIYLSEDDFWLDLTADQLEGSQYRLFDAPGHRLAIDDGELRVVDEAAAELTEVLRDWLLWAGADWIAERPRTLPELLDVALDWAGAWDPREPRGDDPLVRGLGAAFLVLVAAVFAAAVSTSLAGGAALQAVQAAAGGAAVALLLVAAAQIWCRRRWRPWVAAHVALMAVAAAATLIATGS